MSNCTGLAFLATLVTTSTALAQSPDLAALKKMTARFAPVELNVDTSALADNELRALGKLIEAAKLMDGLFLRQSWAGNSTLLTHLAADESPLGRARLHYFLINKGPWSRLDADAPFIPGVGAAPEAGSFYPSGSTKADVEQWMMKLPAPERKLATNFFTTVRRMPNGKFTTVPYGVEYQGELELAARLLREAAELTSNGTLKHYLALRADAFLTTDYYPSDLAWMELDSPVEPTIGPYEVYEDKWLNNKAAFEAFITLRDDAETQKLQKFSAELQDIENHLPIDGKLRNPKLGAMAPIRVVNSLFCSGDANRGVQTAAFNLPNDERIAKEKGTKRVMLKNVQEAKFQRVLLPISRALLQPADRRNVAFDAFFTHILMHELMHGLGPHSITVGGKPTTVREELQDTYSAIEEAKADISGLFALQHLIDKGVIDKAMERTMYVTYLASMFRSIRFGITEAHGKGVALQLNYLLDAGAVVANKNGTFSVDASKIKASVTSLTNVLMTLQADGDRGGATAQLQRLGVVRPEVQKALDRLANVPVDIEPRFTSAEKLLAKLRPAP